MLGAARLQAAQVTRSILWTNDHGVTETFFAGAAPEATQPVRSRIPIMSGLGPAAPADAAVFSGHARRGPHRRPPHSTWRSSPPRSRCTTSSSDWRRVPATSSPRSTATSSCSSTSGRRELDEFLGDTKSVVTACRERRTRSGGRVDRINSCLAAQRRQGAYASSHVALVEKSTPARTADV